MLEYVTVTTLNVLDANADASNFRRHKPTFDGEDPQLEQQHAFCKEGIKSEEHEQHQEEEKEEEEKDETSRQVYPAAKIVCAKRVPTDVNSNDAHTQTIPIDRSLLRHALARAFGFFVLTLSCVSRWRKEDGRPFFKQQIICIFENALFFLPLS